MKIYANTIIADATDQGILIDIEPTKIIFENLTEEDWILDKMDFKNVIESVTCDVCKNCGGHPECWNCKGWLE
jgi:hypothetical protein